MNLLINDLIIPINSFDINISFINGVATKRFTSTVSDFNFDIETLINLKDYIGPVSVKTTLSTDTYENLKLVNARKNYGLNNRITIDFIEANTEIVDIP